MGHKKRVILTEEERVILESLVDKDLSLVGQSLGISCASIYQRLYRIRKRVEEAQTLLKQISIYKKRSARLAKLLTRSA
jgi:predicted DNA-binding protein YlxM (UPF0122 family)